MAPDQPSFIGLTGAIGSGKSAVLAALARLGAATLSADEVAHDALGAPEIAAKLVDRWGPEVAPVGAVDRAKVGEIVFADRGELQWLESVTHPEVGRRVYEWRLRLDPATQLGVVEVPLLFEAGMETFFDGVLAVVAGDERRDGWLKARGDAGVEGRTDRQLTEAEKAERADWVVLNDGTLAELAGRMEELWPELVAAGRAE